MVNEKIDVELKQKFRDEKCNIAAMTKDKAALIPKGSELLAPLQSEEEFEKILYAKNWAVVQTAESNILFFDSDPKNPGDFNKLLEPFFNRRRDKYIDNSVSVNSQHGFLKIIDSTHEDCVKFANNFHKKVGIEVYAEKHWVIFAGIYYNEHNLDDPKRETTWYKKDDLHIAPIMEFEKKDLDSVFSKIKIKSTNKIHKGKIPADEGERHDGLRELGFQKYDELKQTNDKVTEELLYDAIIQSDKIEKIYEYVKGESKYEELLKIIEWVLKKKSIEDKVIPIEQLNEITDPRYAGEIVRVKVIVASNLIPYNVPYKLEAYCGNDEENHSECSVGKIKKTVPEKDLPTFVDLGVGVRQKSLYYFTGNSFGQYCKPVVTETESITINKMKIRPIMNSIISDGEGFTDEQDNKYSSFDIYLIQRNLDINLTAGKEIEITGYVIPDPKNSKVTIMVTMIKELNTNDYDLEKIKEIQEFHKGKNSEFIVNWFTTEFEKFSEVVKREDITTLVLLTMFSSLGFKFENEEITGWVNSIVMGDTTTGKSKTVKKLIILLKAGQIVSGEMATLAGIAGGAVQVSGGSWFIDFGVLPLQDKKFLAIDGAHKLGKQEIDKLAEAERNGKIEIIKVAKASAWARTRQCKIMNPIDDDIKDVITMHNFIHPVRAITNSFQLQSIARIDLAIFISDDVGSEDRNVPMTDLCDPLLENYSDVLKLIWSRKCAIKFEDGVIDVILEGAKILESKFKTDEIPLITNNEKHKLAKLSASIAGFTCSFNEDYTEIIVKKEHVDYIINFITKIYTASGLGKIAEKGMYGEIDIKLLHEIVEKINDKISGDGYETPVNLIKWIGEERKITRDDVTGEFTLTRDKQTIPLLSYLVNENIIKRTRTGFTVTNKGITLTKFIINSGKNIYQDLEDFHNKLFKTFRCDGCGTGWKHTRDSIEEVQKFHGTCVHDGKIVEVVE